MVGELEQPTTKIVASKTAARRRSMTLTSSKRSDARLAIGPDASDLVEATQGLLSRTRPSIVILFRKSDETGARSRHEGVIA